MALRSTTPSLLARTTADLTRPVSQVTDNFFTEFEDDESDAEQDSLKSSNESVCQIMHVIMDHIDMSSSTRGGGVTPQSPLTRFRLLKQKMNSSRFYSSQFKALKDRTSSELHNLR